VLYRTLPNMTEGELSRIRANLVRQETLHQLALDLGLVGMLRLVPCSCPRVYGKDRSTTRRRASRAPIAFMLRCVV
ncbi:MAG: ribonuclease III domain-containing protein, partial [Burkholderiaceae bacterium]